MSRFVSSLFLCNCVVYIFWSSSYVTNIRDRYRSRQNRVSQGSKLGQSQINVKLKVVVRLDVESAGNNNGTTTFSFTL